MNKEGRNGWKEGKEVRKEGIKGREGRKEGRNEKGVWCRVVVLVTRPLSHSLLQFLV